MKTRFDEGPATRDGGLLSMCTGYVLEDDEQLEIEARDVRQMLNALETNPGDLRVMLEQLLLRFPEERLGKGLCATQTTGIDQGKPLYEYGTLYSVGTRKRARRNRMTGKVQFRLNVASPDPDFWVAYDSSWWPNFIANENGAEQ